MKKFSKTVITNSNGTKTTTIIKDGFKQTVKKSNSSTPKNNLMFDDDLWMFNDVMFFVFVILLVLI